MSVKRAQVSSVEEYEVNEKPFYLPGGDEVQLFEAAALNRIPVLLKGPTGTGKTRFVEYMSWHLKKRFAKQANSKSDKFNFPLVTISCHEDLSASDLVGRFLIDREGTRWVDGPLTRVVKGGGICYLDEIVEARKDTTVIIHSLTDHRRLLMIEKLGQIVSASPFFIMAVSYNPGYQSSLKDMKHSTRQRFVAIEFDFPKREQETKIIIEETGVDREVASNLAHLGEMVRRLKGHGVEEGVSTRSLIYAANLINNGLDQRRACEVAVSWGITDDREVQHGVNEAIRSVFA